MRRGNVTAKARGARERDGSRKRGWGGKERGGDRIASRTKGAESGRIGRTRECTGIEQKGH